MGCDTPSTWDAGKAKRYRRDAQVQLKKAAEAENRRLEDHLAKVGTLEQVDAPPEPEPVTFAEAVKHFRATHMKSALKPTTRIGYNVQLDTLLLPRFGDLPVATIDRSALVLLDAELVDEGSRRALVLGFTSWCFRSVRDSHAPRPERFLKPRSYVRIAKSDPE